MGVFFLCGDPSTLNLASMMDSNCVGTCSWTRTVTNPDKSTSHWNVTTTSPAGVPLTVEVSPEANSDDFNMKLKKSKDATITVTADTTFTPNGWHFGTLNLDRNLDKGPDLHMPIVVFASDTTNGNLFNKTVDVTSGVEAGDTLTYEIAITNGQLVGEIELEDSIPAGTTFVPASETEVVIGGTTTSPFAFNGSSMTWTGELDPAGIIIAPSPIFGYIPMSGFAAPAPCPSNCDEGGFLISGLDITYNGVHYSTAIWSVNGALELGTASGSTSGFINTPLPNPASPNNLLAPFWGDMNLGAGGNWYLAGVTDSVRIWDVFEWEAVPEWPNVGANTFQIWLERGSSNITFIYDATAAASFVTIGAENVNGTIGDTWFFNGAGTPPDPATDLGVFGTPGGSATLGFQVTVDECNDPGIANEARISNHGDQERAIATSTCD